MISVREVLVLHGWEQEGGAEMDEYIWNCFKRVKLYVYDMI